MKQWKPNPYALFAAIFTATYLFMLYHGWFLQHQVYLLASTDAGTRAEARSTLTEMGKNATYLVLTGIRDSNAAVRRESAAVLGAIGDKRAIPALRKCLGDNNTQVRRAAKNALVRLKDSSVLQELVRDAASSDKTVRSSALQALGGMRTKAAAKALVRAVEEIPTESPDGSFQSFAARDEIGQTIVRMGSVAVDTVFRHFLSQLRGGKDKGSYLSLLQQMGPEIVPKLIPLLSDKDLDVQCMAAMALMNQSKRTEVQQALLGKIRDGRAPDQLRLTCLYSLAASGTSEAEQVALSLLNDKKASSKYRAAAAEALGYAKSPQAQAALLAASSDKDSNVRLKALESMTGVNKIVSTSVLAKAFSDPNGAVRRAASLELTSFSPRALPILAQWARSPNPQIRQRVAEALANVGNTGEFSIHCQLLLDSNVDVVRAAVSSVPDYDDPRYGSILSKVACLESNPPDVRVEAYRRLVKKNPQMAEPVRRVLINSKNAAIASAVQSIPGQ